MRKILTSLLLAYLRLAAKIQLVKIHPKIVALTGSVGKTSLRNAVATVLTSKYRVKKSVKANSETGIPLDLLDLHPRNYGILDWLCLLVLVPIRLLMNWRRFDVYVVELGIDDPFPPKNMEYLLRFIKPDISVFLNVAPVHTEQFSKLLPTDREFKSKEEEVFLLKAIAKEKGRIITDLTKDKVAVANRDDSYVWQVSQKTGAKLVSFGIGKDNSLQIGEVDYHFAKKKCLTPADVTTFFSFYRQGKRYKLGLSLLAPDYYASSLAAALVVGLEMGVSLEKGMHFLRKKFKLPPGRMNLFKGIKDSLLIDSSYNASKQPTIGALELLKMTPMRPRVVVLGDMRELGNLAKQEHLGVARKILTVADQVFLIGPLTKEYILPNIKKVLPTQWFVNSWQAANYLKQNLKKGSVVLIKGSQNTIFTEIVVEALLKDKKDVQKLCRRGEFWDRQRQNLKG